MRGERGRKRERGGREGDIDREGERGIGRARERERERGGEKKGREI